MTRPSSARVATPKDRKKKQEEIAGAGVAITVGGVRYEISEGEVCGADVRDLRRATGYSFRGLLEAFTGDDGDLDHVASIVWLSRRMAGERHLSFDDVARDVTYDQLVAPEGDTNDGDNSPEA